MSTEGTFVKYIDRQHAGRALAELLKDYAHRKDVIILALPRGGVPVAYEIAIQLSLPMDIFIVRKLGVPGHAELAMGAIASDGITVLNHDIVDSLHIKQSSIESVKQKEQAELIRREELYRGKRPFPNLSGKTILLVDDGIATGSTMKAAISALQQKKPSEIVITVPVAAQTTCDEMMTFVKTMVCPLRPVDFYAVGLWYEHFDQTTDEEVIELLALSKQGKNKTTR